MAFYGNLNNTVRSQFYFDKVYPNRKAMDDNAASDQVYLGRYVLVEYESEVSEDFLPSTFYYKTGKLYSSANLEASTVVTTKNSNLKNGDIIKLPPKHNKDNNNQSAEFHLITTSGTSVSSTKISAADSKPYFINYNIDLAHYFKSAFGQDTPKGRGYDSTVWQKVYDNGKEHYVMVAELNSSSPVFDLSVDAPTTTPITPHFDPSSSNIYYKLHVQPGWGMWVKSANTNQMTTDAAVRKSDEVVDYTWQAYDPATNTVVKKQTFNAPAAIYFNKAGFSKTKRGYDSATANTISVLPTGISGTKYYDHNTDSMKASNDIYELAIQLPAIGNAVSDLWDVMYGTARNLDINWNSHGGLRFIKTDGNGGFEYDTAAVQTLAGTINSMHDIMGMIIKNINLANIENSTEVDKLEDGYIYYNTADKKFYRKGLKYTYDTSKVVWRQDNGGPFYVENVTADNYVSNMYYVNDPTTGNKVPDIANTFIPGQIYYSKQIEPGAKVPIGYVVKYEPNKYYYYKAIDKALYLATDATFSSGLDYRELDASKVSGKIQMSQEYKAGRYYLFDGLNYLCAHDSTPTQTYDKYYKRTGVSEVKSKIYIPGYFYYLDENDNVIQENALTFTPGRQYYHMILNDELEVTLNKVSLITFEPNKYYLFNDDNDSYYLITEPISQLSGFKTPPNSYTVSFEALQYDFYVPNKYWYKSGNNYFQATQTTWDQNKHYCTIDPTGIKDIDAFYQPNKFWYFNEDYQMWLIDEALTPSAKNGLYYYSNTYYVVLDKLQLVEEGSLWNENISIVPHPITIGVRSEKSVLKELRDFSRSYNTLHGLILQINQKLESDDMYTRDLNTLQGAMNYLHDCVNKISNLYPGEFVVVDSYGRMHSANLKTDDCIEVNVNPSIKRPEVVVKHKNMNTENTYPIDQTFMITDDTVLDMPYNIVVDGKGHVSNIARIKMQLSLDNSKISYEDNNGSIAEISLKDLAETVARLQAAIET